MKGRWKWVGLGYVVLLLASQVWVALKGEDEEVGSELGVELVEGWLAYREFGERSGVPVIFSHGSPGDGSSMAALATALAAEGRWVLVPDRWGFGRSGKEVRDYSFVWDARALVDLMNQLEIEEADVMGWSYGGGVVLEMSERWPERVRSLGLLGAIGIQEGEGSGSYYVEHAKYGLMWLVGVVGVELVPHFGLAPPRWFRKSAARDFWDADQRNLKRVLENLEKPLLIVHGKKDPLIAAWVAERHHELVSGSRLVMMEGSHFFPFGMEGMETAVRELEWFLERVERGEEVGGAVYEVEGSWLDGLRGWKPWVLVMGVGALSGWWRGRWMGVLLGLGSGFLLFDWMTALVGLLVAAQWRRKGWEWAKVLGLFVVGSCVGSVVFGAI